MENLEYYKQIIKSSKHKLTEQRICVLKVLNEHIEEHLSIEEIYKYAKVKNNNIGQATIYRIMTLFENINLVYRLNFGDSFSRYELRKDTTGHRHHHLICKECGKVMEIKEDLLDKLEEEIKDTKGFLVLDHRVKFYGICKECQKKDK